MGAAAEPGTSAGTARDQFPAVMVASAAILASIASVATTITVYQFPDEAPPAHCLLLATQPGRVWDFMGVLSEERAAAGIGYAALGVSVALCAVVMGCTLRWTGWKRTALAACLAALTYATVTIVRLFAACSL